MAGQLVSDHLFLKNLGLMGNIYDVCVVMTVEMVMLMMDIRPYCIIF
jgi:hypothetical protein